MRKTQIRHKYIPDDLAKRLGGRAFTALVFLKNSEHYAIPMRELWRALQNCPCDTDDGYDNFSDITLGRYERLGLIQRIKLPKNLVLITLTQYGYDVVQAMETPKRYQKVRLEQLNKWLERRLRWFDQENMSENMETIKEMSIGIDKQKVVKAIARHLGRELGDEDFYVERHPENTEDREKYERIAAALRPMFKTPTDDLTETFDAYLNKIREKEFTRKHAKEMEDNRRFGVTIRKLEPCLICGTPTHVSAAVEDAALIERHTGKKTGILCCRCKGSLEWMEKYIHKPEST